MDLKLILLIVTLVCISIAAFITTDKIRDKRKRWYKSITPKGLVIIILNILVFGVSIFQYIINDIEIQEKENLQDIKDSTNSAMIIDNTQKNISIVTNILGKYGLALDSTNKRLVKLLRDSAKTRVIEPNAPVLVIPENGIRFHSIKDSLYRFDLDVVSFDASSTGFNCRIHFLVEDINVH